MFCFPFNPTRYFCIPPFTFQGRGCPPSYSPDWWSPAMSVGPYAVLYCSSAQLFLVPLNHIPPCFFWCYSLWNLISIAFPNSFLIRSLHLQSHPPQQPSSAPSKQPGPITSWESSTFQLWKRILTQVALFKVVFGQPTEEFIIQPGLSHIPSVLE